MEANHIKVDQWKLSDLIGDISRSKLRIPQFQRDFVWEKSRVIKLLDSMYKDFPIGSFFFWIAPKEYNIFYRDIPELQIKPPDSDNEITFILDGQQRITSLYAVIKGLMITKTNYYEICFDLDKEIFVARKGDHIRFIPFADIFSETNLKVYNELSDERKKNFQKCREKFYNYPFSIIIVKDKNLEQVCEIFERLNQGGKRLDLFDLVIANTWSKDFKLKEEIETLNESFIKSFGKLKNEIFVQAVSLIKQKQCNRAYQLKLTKENFIEVWDKFSEALKKTIDYLKNNLGVKTFNIISYPSLIPLITYFYYHSKTMNNKQDEKIKTWFWKCSFSERYSSSTLTRMSEDRNLFDKILNNESMEINYPINISLDRLKKINISSRSALRNALLCLLSKRNPLSFKDNNIIALDKDIFSSLNTPEKHHIFPKRFLSEKKETKEANSILNFCFIPSSLNKEITKRDPKEYFSEYKKKNNKFEESLKSHLISFDNESGIWTNNYNLFLEQRGNLILKEIDRVIGGRCNLQDELEDKPEKVLKRIETRIREAIHINLYENFGEDYWEKYIPQDIKENVKKRVLDILKRQPFLKEEYRQPQKKISLCDLLDYLKIILKNWLVFEDEFGSKEETEKHFKNLKEFRNSIAHSKEMSNITKKEGEIALEWFTKSLEYKQPDEEIDHEEENELFERLKEKILLIDKNINLKQNKYYIAFKINNTNFLSVKLRKDNLKVYLKGDSFEDSQKILRDVSDIGHHGTGRYELRLISISDIDYVIRLIKQAYEQIKEKN